MTPRKGTLVLVAVLVATFLYEIAVGAAGSETALLPLGALRTRGSSASDWWRVLTFSFLHLNASHLTLNLAGLLWVGGIVERRVGTTAMVAVFTGAAVMSGIGGLLLGPFLPTTGIAIGASGAVFGLLAAAVLLVSQKNERDRRLRGVLTLCLAAAIVISFLPGVSLAGHLGGLLGGTLVILPIVRRRQSSQVDGMNRR